ncbi:MAG: iron chelate uptake ABC transporter family permease subunit [Tissierellia bacterium]|nr:iron chelate uptake ABC transporter family permease subunit [Tissierellia bacterium]
MDINTKSGRRIIFLISFVLLFFIATICLWIGTADVSLVDITKIVLNKIPIIGKYIDISEIRNSAIVIISNVRLPRIILGAIVGASLGLAGTGFQALFKNPMADPYIIGVSSGAAFGASIGIVLRIDKSFLGMNGIGICAFIGAMVAIFLLMNLGRVNKRLNTNSMLLAGVAIGYMFSAGLSFVMVLNTKDLNKIAIWNLGSLAGKSWSTIMLVLVPFIVSFCIYYYYHRELNIMLLGEEQAKSLGVDIERTKMIILIVGAFLTSMIVANTGVIGFVGLIIPHVTRLIFGVNHKITVPMSTIIGAAFLLMSDTIARTIISPTEIPIGVITGLFGAPFFIFILRKRSA